MAVWPGLITREAPRRGRYLDGGFFARRITVAQFLRTIRGGQQLPSS